MIRCRGPRRRVHAFPSRADDGRGHDLGMIPMALAMGEGGEQNAPLGARSLVAFCSRRAQRCSSFRRLQRIASPGSRRASGRDFLSLVISSALALESKGSCCKLKRICRRPLREPRQLGRSLRRAGLAALIVAIAVAATGILVRRHNEAAVKHWTVTQAVPVVSFVMAAADGSASRLILPRRYPGVVRRTDICSRQWLSEELVFRLRRPR